MPQITAAVIAASVAIVVAFLTPAVTSLRSRRQAIHDKFDAALAGLLLVQAARHTPTGMNQQPSAWSPQHHTEFNIKVHEKGIEFFVQKMADAKVALTAIEQYVPEVRERLTSSWELTEEDEPEFRREIERRRRDAVRAERLFRQRRSLPVASTGASSFDT